MPNTSATSEPETVTVDEQHKLRYRNGMARLGAAVNIVTTDGVGGVAGFAATAVCSVTDNPPTLLVCLNRNSSAYAAFVKNRVVCVNVLDGAQTDLSRLFGGKTPVQERFDAATWSMLETGAPVLDECLVSFDCRLMTVADGGTHDILICQVLAIREKDGGEALIYVNRDYRTLSTASG